MRTLKQRAIGITKSFRPFAVGGHFFELARDVPTRGIMGKKYLDSTQ